MCSFCSVRENGFKVVTVKGAWGLVSVQPDTDAVYVDTQPDNSTCSISKSRTSRCAESANLNTLAYGKSEFSRFGRTDFGCQTCRPWKALLKRTATGCGHYRHRPHSRSVHLCDTSRDAVAHDALNATNTFCRDCGELAAN